jgi:hypothetical protein
VREIDERLWLLTDVRWESGPDALRAEIGVLDRAELERLLALAVEAMMEAESRAEVEIKRFQRRHAKRQTKP